MRKNKKKTDPSQKELKKKKRGRLFKRVFLSLVMLGLSCVLFLGIYILRLDAWYTFDPDKILNAPQSLVVLDAEGEEVSCLSNTETRIWISLNQIPLHVQRAFISAEDARFYEHIGVDFIRILGAALEDLKAGKYVQGASTITQQLIKLSHLSSKKVITRKLEEAVMAYQMERHFSKDEILEMYLNYVYFGGGYYGVEAAARGYFGVSAKDLSVAQGAMLAGILKGPSNYAPHLNMENCLNRRNLTLNLMRDYGYLDEMACNEAKKEKVVLNSNLNKNVRGYYVDLALQEACEIMNISMTELLEGGYTLHTAMDQDLQNHCEGIMQDGAFFPKEAQDAEAAIVIVNVKTGGVSALMGGRESTTALAFNRATRIRRQPGSVIKPIIAYAPALEYEEYTTVSTILDQPTDFYGYQPSNFGEKYKGWVTLREAVSQSLNVPAVKVLDSVGVETGKNFSRELGIEFDEKDTSLTLALGGFTYGVSPFQIAGAYAAFAAGGVYSEPSLILEITNRRGDNLYTYKPEQKRVMSEGNAYILTDMLQSAIQHGTGSRLNDLGIQIAGKTGTTGEGVNNRDAWMAAYNPEYAAAVWMGYDESGEGKVLPQSATGGTFPALILKSIFSSLYEEESAPVFSRPDDVIEVRLDGHTLDSDHLAVLANALTPKDYVVNEVFVEGTQPYNSSDYWVVPRPPAYIKVDLDEEGYPNIHFTPVESFIIYRLYREDSYGQTISLGEWSGKLDEISYQDRTVEFGRNYSYYVLPVHPQLKIAGQEVVGPATIKYHIFVPRNPFISTLLNDLMDIQIWSSSKKTG